MWNFTLEKEEVILSVWFTCMRMNIEHMTAWLRPQGSTTFIHLCCTQFVGVKKFSQDFQKITVHCFEWEMLKIFWNEFLNDVMPIQLLLIGLASLDHHADIWQFDVQDATFEVATLAWCKAQKHSCDQFKHWKIAAWQKTLMFCSVSSCQRTQTNYGNNHSCSASAAWCSWYCCEESTPAPLHAWAQPCLLEASAQVLQSCIWNQQSEGKSWASWANKSLEQKFTVGV